MTAKRVVVADEDLTVRAALRPLLERGGYVVVGEAEDCRDAMALVRAHSPDVLIIDLALPGLDALELVKRVSGKTDTRTVVLTGRPAEKYAARARSAGAAAYVTKTGDLANLGDALQAVATGGTFFPEE
ncbi:ANTAR domain-containing response regulator [Streptomyces virginiae]|uniref:ANTAR domain-containing response regulator n=1 Tax=Streptomyces virginiae TaxID=1961 RepID=UPI003427B346